MCGIGLSLLCNQCSHCRQAREAAGDQQNNVTQSYADSLHQSICDELANRGPDLTRQQYTIPASFSFDVTEVDGAGVADRSTHRHEFGIIGRRDTSCTCFWHLTLLASVLHMRGEELTTQPYILENYNDIFVLCFNGEVYSYNFASSNLDIDLNNYDAADEDLNFRSDTKDFMAILSSAIKRAKTHNLDLVEEHEAVANAISHVHGEFSFILYHQNKDVSKTTNHESIYFCRDPLGRRSLLLASEGDQTDDSLSPSSLVVTSTSFSIDETNLAFKEIEAGRLFRIDMRRGAATSLRLPRPTQSLPPLVEHDASYATALKENGILESLVRASETFHALLDRAVRRRVINAPRPKHPVDDSDSSAAASVGILFSGGIDSVVLAAMSDAHVPPDQSIDLINVAFFSSEISISASPDRAAALVSFEEMNARWPERQWRFIAVDVPYGEVLENEEKICRLIAPLDSTMDFNIATAFWFASRGRGVEVGNDNKLQTSDAHDGSPLLRFASSQAAPQQSELQSQEANAVLALSTCQSNAGMDAATSLNAEVGTSPYISQARVLLIGIGADEQLGGYGRHRSVYNKGGYEALRAELKMERERIWTRNLGRDDRVVSDHGKEARFPFLDEDVVGFLQSLDVLDICDMERPQGEGDKLILRLVAKKLGVKQCSNLVKRAIQFGSRIAKCSDVDRFGSSRKAQGSSRHRQSSTEK